MTGRRLALLVATDAYDNAGLSQLRSPAADAEALGAVLGDPDIGQFDVDVLRNATSWEVQARVEELLTSSRPDDLVLVHFSGHGIKNDAGELFIAARNTRPDLLAATSVPADFVQRCLRGSRAGSVVLFLDCCYGGAFGEGVSVKAARPVNVHDALPAERLGGGRGRAVITASSAIEYAFEGSGVTTDHDIPPSVFTSAVVQGLRTGDADRDEDGRVSLGELYDYVFDRVQRENPHQTPGRDIEMAGDVYLAKSRRKRLRPVPLPERLSAALSSPDPTLRRGAVVELRDRLAHTDLGVALGALEALRDVVRNDMRVVAQDAEAAIATALPSVTPSALDLGEFPRDAYVAVAHTLQLAGIPLARHVETAAEPPLAAVVTGDTVTVTFAPNGAPFSGVVTVTSPAGSTEVPVTARIGQAPPPPPPPPPEPTPPEPTPSEVVPEPPDVVPEPPEPTPPEPAPAPPEVVPEPPAGPTVEELADARRTRRSAERLGWTLVVAGSLLALGSSLPWMPGSSVTDLPTPALVAFAVRAVLVVGVGVLLLVRTVTRPVSAGALFGTAVASAATLLAYIAYAVDIAEAFPAVGWVLALLADLVIIACGVRAAVASGVRGSIHLGRWENRPAVWVMLVSAYVASVAFLQLAGRLQEQDVGQAWVVASYAWMVLDIVVTLAAAWLRPSTAIVAALSMWNLTLVGLYVAGAVAPGYADDTTLSEVLGFVAFTVVTLVSSGHVGTPRAPRAQRPSAPPPA